MSWWRRYLVWRQRNVRRVAVTGQGFALTGGSMPAELAWSEVRQITAFKRDLLTVDLLCLLIEAADGTIEVDEEMAAYAAFEDAVTRYFGLAPDWKLAVLFPAFATNPTTVYPRSSVPA